MAGTGDSSRVKTRTKAAAKPAGKSRARGVASAEKAASIDAHRLNKPAEPRALRVLALMVDDGISTTAACQRVGIGWQAFSNWVQRKPANVEMYASARARLLERMAEEIHQIADTPVLGETTTTKPDGTIEVKAGDMIEHRKLQIDARKWTLSKLLPHKYGDRQQIDHNVTDSMAEVLMGARKRSGIEKP